MPQDPKEREETITEEITRVVAEVERMTGLRSRWNGSVTIWEAHMMQAMARKPFGAAIGSGSDMGQRAWCGDRLLFSVRPHRRKITLRVIP